MKECTKCHQEKYLDAFAKRKDSPDGYRGICKTCRNTYARSIYMSGQDHDRSAIYREANRLTINAKERANYDPKKEKARKAGQYLRLKYTGRWAKATALRRTIKKSATPKWLNQDHMSEIAMWYEGAQLWECHVDHIVPLQGKTVCGLHVPWNMQLLTPKENYSKSNKLINDF